MSRRFLKFCIVGAVNTGIDFGAFLALYYAAGWPLLLAHGVAFAGATVNSYFMNRAWTFQASRQADGKAALRQFLFFVAVTVGGLALSSAVVWWLSHYMAAWAAKIFAIGAGLAWNFTGSTLFVFRRREGDQSPPRL